MTSINLLLANEIREMPALEWVFCGLRVEIRGIPLPDKSQEEDTNEIVHQLNQKMGIPLERNDISVSHRIRSSRSSVDLP